MNFQRNRDALSLSSLTVCVCVSEDRMRHFDPNFIFAAFVYILCMPKPFV